MNCLESMTALMRPLSAYSLRTDNVVYAELAGYYAGLRSVEEQLALLWREGLVGSAQEFGLREWERMIRSTAFESADVDVRRRIVVYTLCRMPGDFNREGMLRGLRSLGLECELLEDTSIRTVTVMVNGSCGMLRTYEQVLSRVSDILPAHVNVVLDVGIVTWELLDDSDRSFDEADAQEKSWDEFELTQP